MRFHKTTAFATSIVVCLFSAQSNAQDESRVHPLISSRYVVQTGMFFPSKNFHLSVDGSVAGANQEFDFEKATGFGESDEVFEIEFGWRFGAKWSAHLQHFTTDRTEKAVLEQDITWRDETILAGSSVSVGANFQLSRLFFGRSFGKRENVDTGVGFGVHWVEIGAFVKPDVITTFGDVSAAKVSGPLPNIGFWYYYSLSPRWMIGARLDWLEANVGKYDGGMTNVSAGVNYQLFQHVGIGLKYQAFRLNVDVDNESWHGSTTLDLHGAYVYLSVNW